MKPKLFIRGDFVYGFFEHAAEELGIDLILTSSDKGIREEIEEVNSAEGVVGYLYFASWGDDFHRHAPLIKWPKIFWNLEDPNHFNAFFHHAQPADIIITSAAEVANSYQAVYEKPTYVLTWGCEPKLHYPNEDDPTFDDREFDIVFIGNRYPNEYDRVIGEQAVLLPALEWAKEHKKKIGFFGIGDASPHSWRFVPQVWLDERNRVPYLGHDMDCESRNPSYSGPYQSHTSAFDAAAVYRRSTVVLCVNEQLYSPTMTSMRTYEACACGNIVLSHVSLATTNIFGDLILHAGTPEETKAILDDIWDESGKVKMPYFVRARRATAEMYEHETYSHRLTKLLQIIYDTFQN